ncbi:hypothetical protein [Nostoc sp. UHCC 0251]|nr:hypothetical protein [Nostoc sp. UHCC 0251]MEA5624666.1 hypothetical protein [Nostoc sp. UHCC 0251]
MSKLVSSEFPSRFDDVSDRHENQFTVTRVKAIAHHSPTNASA